MPSLRRSRWTRALALFLAAAAAWAAPAPDRDIFRQIDSIMAELQKITGMRVRHRVPSDFISRQKVKEFLEKRVKEVTTPEELRAEELTLKKFGLVPADFDLARTTVDLLTEQAAAFYDYNEKRLFITDWTETDSREAALVHELAHALADQNFNLARYIKKGQKSDDGATARMAVMEGQASWLMAEYMARAMGQSLKSSPALLDGISSAMERGTGQFPVYEQSPLYMRRTLLFPYLDGMRFQQRVVERMGQEGFAEVFRRAPVSTQQILHAQKYFDNVQPVEPPLPDWVDRKGFKELVSGSMGELDHSVLLEQYAGKEESAAVAPHWTGGRYRLLERRSPERAILEYASAWDSPEMARRYFQLYRRVLGKKWQHMRVEREGPDSVWGQGDDGYFVLRIEGRTVSSVEGLESAPEAAR